MRGMRSIERLVRIWDTRQDVGTPREPALAAAVDQLRSSLNLGAQDWAAALLVKEELFRCSEKTASADIVEALEEVMASCPAAMRVVGTFQLKHRGVIIYGSVLHGAFEPGMLVEGAGDVELDVSTIIGVEMVDFTGGIAFPALVLAGSSIAKDIPEGAIIVGKWQNPTSEAG